VDNMAKRDGGTARTKAGTTRTSGATAAVGVEQRLMALAEQLGRVGGTVQNRAESLMDREALKNQIASVRDGAADLLEQLAGGAKKPQSKKTAPKKAGAAPARSQAKGRSGGVVDAPGKKHRKPLPSAPVAVKASSQAAKVQAVKTMVKTPRRRGRG
jgi:hypothetical protein